MDCCDLHVHSFYSDGTCSPQELVEKAVLSDLRAIALTDHNTMDGLNDFFEAAAGKIEVCGGCEITTEVAGQELHLLGLFLHPQKTEPLQKALAEQLGRKEQSNRETIERMSTAGYEVSYSEFADIFGSGVKNRVHIAKYLMRKGIVSEISEAFQGLLSESAGFYRETKKLDFYQMITLIHEAGGVAVWAHPLFHVDRETCEAIIIKAKSFGLDGAEVYYSTYSDDETEFMRRLCAKYHLLESGGSDYHGDNKPGIQIGRGYGQLQIPFSCYEKLKKCAEERNKHDAFCIFET